MTRSDNIIEFLKYASPRLEYIEHCMEKQALSPARALQAVKAFRARSSKGVINPAKYKRLGALSKSVGKLRGNEKNQLNNVAGKLHKKYRGYVKGDYNRVRQRAAAPSFEEAYFNQYGRMPDQSMINASLVPNKSTAPKATSFEEAYFNQYGRMPEQSMINASVAPNKPKPTAPKATSFEEAYFNQYGRMPDQSMIEASVAPPKTKKPAAGGDAAKPDAANAGAANANDAEPGLWDNITSWVKENPYLAMGGGAAVGAAGGAGIGYGVGTGSGRQEGSQIAQRYYELREALDRQRLQRTNDSFLSRLGNLFGAGDLSNLIG